MVIDQVESGIGVVWVNFLEKWQRWWLLGRKEKRMTNGDQITANGGHGGRQNYVFH